MTLEHWAKTQDKQGNKNAAKEGRELIEQYGDVPLPSKEQQEEALRFSQEQLQDLEKEGYLIYELREQSIRSLKEQGKRFNSDWHKGNSKFEALTSRKLWVAINPNQLFLPNSNKKTLNEREEVVKEFSEELSRKIPGIEAFIGEAPEYVELAFKHLDKTSERLFGEKYKYYYTITKTPTEASLLPLVAIVGYFDEKTSIDVSRRRREDRSDNNVWVAPLVRPARTPSEKYSGTQA